MQNTELQHFIDVHFQVGLKLIKPFTNKKGKVNKTPPYSTLWHDSKIVLQPEPRPKAEKRRSSTRVAPMPNCSPACTSAMLRSRGEQDVSFSKLLIFF